MTSRDANADIARRAYEAATRRPKPDFATVNALFHPDHELISLRAKLEGRSASGAGEYRELLDTMNETFASWKMDVERVEAIDDDRVLITVSVDATGKASAAPIEQRFWHVLTVRNGKIIRTVAHSSREEAITDASGRGAE